MGALATPELTAESLAMVGGAYVYLAAVYLEQNREQLPTKSLVKRPHKASKSSKTAYNNNIPTSTT